MSAAEQRRELPAAQLDAMEEVRTPIATKRLVRVCIGFCLLMPLCLIFLPWQQHVTGAGRVVALDPQNRPQMIEAPVSGRVASFSVTENSRVEEGDLICEIVDIDPQRLERLDQERGTIQLQLAAAENQRVTYLTQIENLELVRDNARTAAQFRVDMAQQRVRSWQEELRAAEAAQRAAEQHFERMRNLHEHGLASTRDFEVAQRDHEQAGADVESARAALAAAESDTRAAGAEVERVEGESQARVESARAGLRAAEQKIEEVRAKLVGMDGEIARQQSQKVVAPRSGLVNRILVATNGPVVSVKEPLIELVPDAQQLAAEIMVKGIDAPLIKADDPVRLQFEGWPAVQFAGWPSVAIGSFGGRVKLVDPRDDGQGRFRILVVPDPHEPPWPDETWLRQGAKSKGFVLLRQVRLGYEIWRQLNGFPPALDSAPKDGVARKRLK
ncbi:MAG: HlyD family secretion protein [Phycisphaerae bacterium]